jgi:hypothetical protein
LDFLYLNAFQLCEQISQIQSTILENLKFANNLFITSVHIEEDLIREVRNRIKTAYSKSMIPLFAYLKKLEKYRSLFNLNIKKYIV